MATKLGAGAVVTVVGLVLGVAGSLGPPWPVDPDIAPVGADPGSPFSLPFATTNKSLLFAMHNVSVTCLIDHALAGGVQMNRIGITKPTFGYIGRQDSKNFGSGISAPPSLVQEATIRIQQTYGLGWFGKRTYITEPFV